MKSIRFGFVCRLMTAAACLILSLAGFFPPEALSAENAAPIVEIGPEQQKMIGVKTVEAGLKPLRRTIRTVGRVTYDESKVTTVNLRYEGWIDGLTANYTGMPVKKGDVLATVWSPELTSLKLEYLNLLKWMKDQIPRYQRVIEFEWADRYGTNGKFATYDPALLVDVAKQKFQLWGLSEADLKDLETNQDAYARVPVASPADGFILEKPGVKGTRFEPGEKLFDIVDLSTVWVLADIFEYEMPLLQTGQEALITLSYFPDKVFKAKVDFVYPTLSGRTRTVKARFLLENPDHLLKPQMFANVELSVELGDKLAIPSEAVLDTGLRQIVYVDKGDGNFEPRVVKTGVRADSQVEVREGLEAGERVALRPVFLIDSEAKLKGIVP